MLLGAHESAAGGCHRVFERCARDGAEAVQMWTRSSRQWAAKPLEACDVDEFRRQHAAYSTPKIPTAAHGSYLINLGTFKEEVWQRSVETLLDECQRAEQLGVAQVIFHPGASQNAEPDQAVRRVAQGLRTVCASLPAAAKVRILVEITAGQGTSLGCSFEQLAAILDATGEARIGVCLDTQHMYAAGYDWTSERGYEQTFAQFERTVGFARLEAWHLNDSKKPLGSRVDRHEVIGNGLIGLAPFERLLRDARFAQLPAYLETPPLPDGQESYALGIARLKSLLDEPVRPPKRAAAGTRARR